MLAQMFFGNVGKYPVVGLVDDDGVHGLLFRNAKLAVRYLSGDALMHPHQCFDLPTVGSFSEFMQLVDSGVVVALVESMWRGHGE